MDLLFRLIVFLCSNTYVASEYRYRIKDAHIPVPRLIQRAGYPAENHHALTTDGYILQLHRIPAGRRFKRSSSHGTNGKKVVLLVHGLFGCSSNFIIMGPERSLGYILADAGYDVWLANLRGNWNTAHLNLTRDDPRFWDYSFHEHGKYDVPAIVDKVLTVTGQRRLLYIGHSMGSTSFFTAMTLRPEYNDKVVAVIALAPAVYLDHFKSLAELLLKIVNVSSWLRLQGWMYAMLPPELLDLWVSSMCSSKRSKENLCVQIMQNLVGEDFEQADPDVAMHIMARLQPASWRQLEHYGKIALTGVFTSWKGGIQGGVKPYNISSIRVPVSLLYGDNDQVIQKSDVMRLAHELNGTGMLEEVRSGCSWPRFNHVDFVFANELGSLLNRPLIKNVKRLFEKYEK